MARKLARTVHVALQASVVTYLAGETPLPEHSRLITNPAAWQASVADPTGDDPAGDDQDAGGLAGDPVAQAAPTGDDQASTDPGGAETDIDALALALIGATGDDRDHIIATNSVSDILAALDRLPDETRPAIASLVHTIETHGRARKTLLDALAP